MRASISHQTPTLLEELLAEQRQLTAVDRFTQWHERSSAPAQERYYQHLIPLEKPRLGEQYAFAVDLDACTGCKACVSACHSLNGLDEHETWRTTGLLHGGTQSAPYQQVVTSACHHCVEPACLNGCPVLAYEKDPATGIVRHLDDQCIGCQYCILKCPYDVPKFSRRHGIVRKCDMCHSRLAAGEAPACVQACPSQAIAIRVVNQAASANECRLPDSRLVPGVFPSAYTLPTTTYHTRRSLPVKAAPADAAALRLEPAHWPLIAMLLQTQIAAGLSVCLSCLAWWSPEAFATACPTLSVVGLAALLSGLASSIFHLGRPLGAWRSWLGWRRSWMSREILAFGGFAAAAIALAISSWSGETLSRTTALGILTALLGCLAVFSSGMIYVDTQRPFWGPASTFPRFFGTAGLLGSAGLAATLSWIGLKGSTELSSAILMAGVAAMLIRTALFGWEALSLRQALKTPGHPNHRSAAVIWRYRRWVPLARAVLFLLATGMACLGLSGDGLALAGWTTLSWLATLSSQALERYCFFVAVVPPRMPGGFAP